MESTHQLVRIPIHRVRPGSNTIFTNISQDLELKHYVNSKIMGLLLSYFVYFRQLIYYTAIHYNSFLSLHYCQTIRQAFLPNRLSATMTLPSLSPTPKS